MSERSAVPQGSTDKPGLHRRLLPSKWVGVASFLTVGYLCMSRSFAYLGLPWIDIFIGEATLAAFLLFGPVTKQGRWPGLALRVRRLRRFEWALLLLFCYGGFEAIRGILKGYPAFTAARDTAFDYYPLFILLGVWAGVADRLFLRRVLRMVAWWNGCYGVVWILFLSRLSWTMPGTENGGAPVSLFSGPYAASAVALLGLLAFEPKPRRVWHLILLNLFVLLGELVRAEWLGFAIGVLLFALLTKRLRQLSVAVAGTLLLLIAMVVLNVSLPSPRKTGGAISPRYIVARAVAPVNKNLAQGLAPKENTSEAAGTVEWRLVWWAAIWARVNQGLSRRLLGFGYGYPIGKLNPFIVAGTFIQTPHNDFFYALGYTGWLGVVLFALLQFEIARLLLRSYRITGQPFGLTCWAALLTMSLFEDFFETPFAAIPFFLLIGAALAPALLRAKAEPARTTEREVPQRDRNRYFARECRETETRGGESSIY